MLVAAGLLAYFAFVGFGILVACGTGLRQRQLLLLAPTLGLATAVVLAIALSRLGFSARTFAGPLAGALPVVSAIVLLARRPALMVSFKVAAPFLAICLFASIAAAWPLLLYGFDWLSFANDDMANYSLGALRFLNYPFNEPPHMDELNAGRDYSQAFWFPVVAGGVRAGSEILLAAFWAVSGIGPHQAFMPILLALHLSLILATASMVAGRGMKPGVSLVAASILAVSPLSTYGFLYQLIAQLGGLALLCALVSLTCAQWVQPRSIHRRLLGALPAAIVLVAAINLYPEVLPFFGVGWLILLAMFALFRRPLAMPLVYRAIPVGLLAALLLGPSAIDIARFLLFQTLNGLSATDYVRSIFPYFLLPSGLGAFVGVLPLAGSDQGLLQSMAIGLSVVFCIALLAWAIPAQLRRGGISAAMLAGMVLIAVLLYSRGSGFGLFKLAMYAQPYLACVIAIAAASLPFRRLFWATASLGLVPLLAVQLSYVQRATGELKGGTLDIPHASSLKMIQQFSEYVRQLPAGLPIISSSPITPIQKIQSMHADGRSIYFQARDPLANIISSDKRTYSEFGAKYRDQYYMYRAEKIYGGSVHFDRLRYTGPASRVSINPRLDLFNKFGLSETDVYFVDVTTASNQLEFVNSSLGQHYYLPPRNPQIAYNQLERDPLFSDQKISGVGRGMLLQVRNPTPAPRLVLEVTSTLTKQFDSILPPVSTEGGPLGLVGRGSARVFSPILSLEALADEHYLAVDFGRAPKPFPISRSGLMLLYGADINTDPRHITTFARDISMIDDTDYQALERPLSVSKFPSDLGNKALEYSGIYEDGWIAETSFFVLANPTKAHLHVAGLIPQIADPGFSTTLTVQIDGQVVAQQLLGTGTFDLSMPISGPSNQHRIDLAFSTAQKLPGEDGRMAAAKLTFVGFEG